MFRYVVILILIATATTLHAQTATSTPKPPATLGVESGLASFATADFSIKLVNASQTLAALEPRSASGFDFTPADRVNDRASNGFYQFGDINFRVRVANGEWRYFSTAGIRKPVISLPARAPDIAKSDLTPSLSADCPVQVIRRWTIRNNKLVLQFELINKTDQAIEIGHLGIPLIFNNIITDRTLSEAHEKNSFSDPYIGLDAGYVQVTRLKGNGPALVVVPEGDTPFEAYVPLREPARPQQTAEGMFEWVVRSKALAEKDWATAEPWNPPTSEMLPPKGRREIGLRFLLAPDIRSIENTLKENRRPVAVGIPGYVLPNDIEGKLFLNAPSKVASIAVEPDRAMTITSVRSPSSKWHAFDIKSNGWGRARVSVKYSDGTIQSIHYYLTKPSTEVVADLGKFLFTKQWYENPSDPFGRSPSIMGFDRETNKIVEQDHRVWIAGLGDEGGGGSWVAAAMKQFVQPDPGEITKFERFINGVLWGGLQYKDGPNKYGVRKSMLYYSPDEFPTFQYDKNRDWTTWASWKKDQAMSVGRGYNYPHVVAAYWSMYRTLRDAHGFAHPWNWYLTQAFETTRFAFSKKADGKYRVEYVDLGLMEGTIFLELLKDLQREGWQAQAAELEGLMKQRADAWAKEEYPFGSEMAWDSTGQEEVYAWSKYFGYDDKARVSLDSITGYMPSIPHWGYNANARRYWDFLYAAKLQRIERQIHHYGSGLNAIPVLDHYRSHPDDEYLLRIGYAGGNAALTNIDREGFASAAFHSYPDTLRWDGYSGDYGMNFFGYVMNAATYVVDMKEFGWQAFGGNITSNRDGKVTITPRDAMRRRVYIAPFGLWLTLDSDSVSAIDISLKDRTVTAYFNEGPQGSVAKLRIEQPARLVGIGTFEPSWKFPIERGAYVIPTDRSENSIKLSVRK